MPNLTDKEKQNLATRLGSDLKFPISGSFEPISGINLLLQDMEQLLLTIPGERVNRPEFGCELRNQIWENLEDAAENGAASIREALDAYEPRITVIRVTSNINRNTGLIVFKIQFIINEVDIPLNLVFPFRAAGQLSFG